MVGSGVAVAVVVGLGVAVGVREAVEVHVEVGGEVVEAVALLPTGSRDIATAFTACDVGPVCRPNLI